MSIFPRCQNFPFISQKLLYIVITSKAIHVLSIVENWFYIFNVTRKWMNLHLCLDWKNKTPHAEMKWKIWTLFNNWFSVINNLKIFYKESQTQYFTNFALFFFFVLFFSFICTKEWSDMDQCPEKKELNLPRTRTFTHSHTHVQEIKTKNNSKHFDFRSQTYQQCCIPIFFYNFT